MSAADAWNRRRHLAPDGELGYMDGGTVTGVFGSTEPFSVEIDLRDLR